MIKDPLTAWDGEFPYDALEAADITPQSTQAEVEDASFTLMTRHLMNPVTQKAWNELRDVQRRLLADFLLYDLDPAAEAAAARRRVQAELTEVEERPEVAEALSLKADSFGSPAEGLAEVRLEPPPVYLSSRALDFPEQSFIDSLIQFDR